MADETKSNTATSTQVTPPTTPTTETKAVNDLKTSTFIFKDKEVNDKLTAVEEALKSYVGKPGYNPFLYTGALRNRLNGGEKTQALQDAIFALDSAYVPEAPGNTAKENRENGNVEPQSAGRSHAMGQIVRPGQG